MNERKILVAKSYQDLPIMSEPYTMNGKEYVKVRMKNGSIKQVRSYTEAEYRRYNPEVKIIKPAKSRRDILGFGEKGFIWIFKGNTYENIDWFRASPCRYMRVWGWYLPSNEELPVPMPADIEPIKLNWDDVSFDGDLIGEDELKKVVEPMLYDGGTSTHIGKIGDKVEFNGTLTKAVISQGYFGISYFYIFEEDETGNIFTWNTTSKSLDEGIRYHVKGTVKEHSTYKATKQTVLTRCRVEEIE